MESKKIFKFPSKKAKAIQAIDKLIKQLEKTVKIIEKSKAINFTEEDFQMVEDVTIAHLDFDHPDIDKHIEEVLDETKRNKEMIERQKEVIRVGYLAIEELKENKRKLLKEEVNEI